MTHPRHLAALLAAAALTLTVGACHDEECDPNADRGQNAPVCTKGDYR